MTARSVYCGSFCSPLAPSSWPHASCINKSRLGTAVLPFTLEDLRFHLAQAYTASPQTLPPKSWWKEQWFTGPLRKELRAVHGKNLLQHLAAYRPLDEQFILNQENGMEAFVRLEARSRRYMAREMRWNDLRRRGMSSLETFENNDSGDDIVFVCIDFEGRLEHHEEVSEFGMATFFPRDQKRSNEIETEHYLLKKSGQREWRRFRFGESQSMGVLHLRDRILDRLQSLARAGCRIILVGQSVHFDLETLSLLDIDVAELPTVHRILDTYHFARETLGASGSLSDLLRTLSIPSDVKSMHCAGNDAHFTMRLLPKLISIRYSQCAGRWDDVVCKPLERAASWDREKMGDWIESMDGAVEDLEIAASLFDESD